VRQSSKATLDIPLVWIEIGRGIPKYLHQNLAITREIHPHASIVLVTDSERKFNLEGVEIVRLEELVSREKFVFEQGRSNWIGTNQREFWINTSFRFQTLVWLMEYLQIENCIHLESDCILLNTEAILNYFKSQKWGIAYPLQSIHLGCASIFAVNKTQSLRTFVNYMFSERNAYWQDDMQILGKYYVGNDDVLLLPTKIDGTSQFIFDAQTVGKFYFGTDARNNRVPFASRAKPDTTAGLLVNDLPKVVNFKLLQNQFGIELSIGSSSQILCNLHLHSKNLPGNIKALRRMCSRAFKSHRTPIWRLGRIDWIVTYERLLDSTKRRVLKETKRPMKYFR
jgi:hypothetical protein